MVRRLCVMEPRPILLNMISALTSSSVSKSWYALALFGCSSQEQSCRAASSPAQTTQGGVRGGCEVFTGLSEVLWSRAGECVAARSSQQLHSAASFKGQLGK